MNKIITAAVLSLSIFGTSAVHAAPAEQGKTRAEVVAELAAAKAAGQVGRGELDYPPAFENTSSRSREDVVAERDAAERAGLISRGELDYPPKAAL